MIRAAIVGIGWWGRTLVEAVSGRSRAIRFTTGFTRTPARAAEFCAAHDIRMADSLDAILADPAIDAVVFTTPHREHGRQVERTAAAGKHVFMEKPFTLDVASADRALAAVARAGVTLGIGYHRRFHPGMIELKARVGDGRLGTVAHCYAEQNGAAGLFMAAASWRADQAESPAGAMPALGVHNVDALIGLFGAIDEVYCLNLQRAMPHGPDTTSIMFGMANGMAATLLSSLVTTVSYRLAVFGTKGCAELLTPNFDFRFTPTPDAPPSTGRAMAPPAETIPGAGFNGLAAELDAFAAAIEGGAPFAVTPAEIRHGVAVFEAIVASAARRQPVKVARD
jgi:predicted dehydrogenase